MFNYADLSDVEFESLAHDVMEKKLSTSLHRFGKGKDGGIDLADDASTKNIIVQVKHYAKTGFSGLLSSLSKEVPKVEKNKPKRYYVVCSCNLTPLNIEQIYDLFSKYMKSTHNIISVIDIDDFLCKEENHDIVKRHYKLWLHSTNVLTDIVSKEIFIDSQVLLSKIKSQSKLFVETGMYRHALDYLIKKRVLLLIGAPGVGKTITSEMLILRFAAEKYSVRFTTDGEDINALKRSLSDNPSKKEIILLDDCLGQYYFKMKDSQENELLSLIRYISVSPNKFLLMNSRVTIYKEAKDRNPDFYKEIENGELKIQVMDMTNITLMEKTMILYNHIYFSNLPYEYFQNLKNDKNYIKIITHKNYSPRIMEFVTMSNIQRKVDANSYYSYIKTALDNPNDIWDNEYSRRLQRIDRILITTLYSLTDTIIRTDMLSRCFNRRIASAEGIDKTLNNFELALNRLNESFLTVVIDKGTSKIGVINPSVNDFLSTRIIDGSPEKDEIVKSIVSVKQAERILGESAAKELIKQKAIEGSIFDLEFENETVKNDYILFCICMFNIKKSCYQDVVSNYLKNPHNVFHYEKAPAPQSFIIEKLSQSDMNDFYDINSKLFDFETLDKLLSDTALDELIDILKLLDPLSAKSSFSREDYTNFIKSYLLKSATEYVNDVDAAEASEGFDINEILGNNTDYDNGLDIVAAADELEELIKLQEKDNLNELLSSLPDDIANTIDIKKDIYVSVNGANSVITSYIEPDYEVEYEGHNSSSTGTYDEIKWIFER